MKRRRQCKDRMLDRCTRLFERAATLKIAGARMDSGPGGRQPAEL